MNKCKQLLIAVAALFVTAVSSAHDLAEMPLESDKPVIETTWRLIGPALSWHSSNQSAPVSQRKGQNTTEVVRPEPDALGTVVVRPGREEVLAWNERHVAIGLARAQRDVLAGSTVRDFGQILTDSYGKLGWMAGRSWSWDLYDGESLRLEAGISAGAWWRTSGQNRRVLDVRYDGGYYRETVLHRRLLPFFLPLATVTHKSSGVDLTVSFVPKSSINEYQISSTDVLMLQVSFPIGR